MKLVTILMIFTMQTLANGVTIGGGPSSMAKAYANKDSLGKPINFQFQDGTLLELDAYRSLFHKHELDVNKVDNIKFDSGEVRKVEELKLDASDIAKFLFRARSLK